MASKSKYVFFQGGNFIDLGFQQPGISLSGEEVEIVGTSDIDRVFVRPGTSVDFVQSGAGADRLYLTGQLSDYSLSYTGTTLHLTRGSGATAESALVSGTGTDVLVFADGSVSASALRAYTVAQGTASPLPLPAPLGETSLSPALPASYASTLKMVAYDATTFAPVEPGIDVTVVGSGEVDTVYVKAGGRIDAVNLGGGEDLVYFTGSWADYAKSVEGTHLVFERTIDGHVEHVEVSRGTAGQHDKLIFADGAAGTRHVAVAENTPAATSIFTGDAVDPDTTAPNNVVSYSIAGLDADYFNVDAHTGAVTFRTLPDFESVSHAPSYAFTLVATDGVGRSALQAVTVDVGDVNEAPVAGAALADQIQVVGHAFSFAMPAGSFTDPDGAGANGTLSYSAALADGSPLPSWLNFDAATGTFSGTAPGILHLDVTVTATDGGATPLSASQTFALDISSAVTIGSALAGVSNFDVTSSIVLTGTEDLTAVAGKYIHLVDLGGAGYGGENTVHTQDIEVTDASQVHIVGNRIVLDPAFDLDLASNYMITIDEGAFTGATSHLASIGVDGSGLHFSTVAPAGGSGSTVASAAASQSMNEATGAMQASYNWWDIEGVGNTLLQVNADLSSGKIAMVFKDWNSSGGSELAGDGVGVNHPFWIGATNFGVDDLLYIDDQSNSAASRNELDFSSVNNGGTQPVRIAFDPAPGVGTEGQGWVDVSLSTSTTPFASMTEMQQLLGMAHPPVVSA